MSQLLWSRHFLVLVYLVGGSRASTTLAHEGGSQASGELWMAWSWEPGVVVALTLAAWLYVRGLMGSGGAVLYVFTTSAHSTTLGALLTFAPFPWYPVYANTAAAWGLTSLEDQQLCGLLMWVPGGVLYLIAGLALLAGWLHAAEGRVRRWESHALLRQH